MHMHTRRGFSTVWAAERVALIALPRCWTCKTPSHPQPPLAGHHFNRRDRGCGTAAACTPLLRPDWPGPRGEAARVASGPDCQLGSKDLLSRLCSSAALSPPPRPKVLVPAPAGFLRLSQPHHTAHHVELDGTMQISFGGWMCEVTGLDLMGPLVHSYPHLAPRTESPMLRRLSLDGYSVHSPSMTRNFPMQVGEKR
jgi:hypothetical protein